MNPVVRALGWRTTLEEVLESGVQPGSDRHKELKRLASEWETCAIGECKEKLKEKGYPFSYADTPTYVAQYEQGRHHDLGMDFMVAVGYADWHHALEILTKIENLPSLTEDTV